MLQDRILSLASMCEERGLFGLYYALAAMYPQYLEDGPLFVEQPLYCIEMVIEGMPLQGEFPFTVTCRIERPMLVGFLETLQSNLGKEALIPYAIRVLNQAMMAVMDCLNPHGGPDNPHLREVEFILGV